MGVFQGEVLHGISIHAPVKGATAFKLVSHYLLSHQSYCELIERQFNFWANYPGIAYFYRNQDGCEAPIYFMCDSASHRFFRLVKSSGYT